MANEAGCFFSVTSVQPVIFVVVWWLKSWLSLSSLSFY